MPETKKRLGRGLNSLLSSTRLQELSQTDAPEPAQRIVQLTQNQLPEEKVLKLPIDEINCNPHQPRINWNEKKLLELADSIKANGLIQPVLVRAMGQGYQLIAGERRLRAARMAGQKDILAIIRHADEEQMIEWALIENIHRADLNPLERANAYKNYVKNFSLSQHQAAQRIGEDRSTIANYMRLLDLPDEIKKLLNDEKITMGHARALLAVDNKQQQLQLADMIVSRKLSVRELERKIQNLQYDQQDKNEEPPEKNNHIIELEREMSQSLGTKVVIKTVGKKRHRGKIIIEFYNLDDFDRLKEKLS